MQIPLCAALASALRLFGQTYEAHNIGMAELGKQLKLTDVHWCGVSSSTMRHILGTTYSH